MRPIAASVMLLLFLAEMTALRSQPVSDAGKKAVLILLRQPEGTLGKRLAEASASTAVPDEVRAAAAREQTSLVEAQQDAFEQRIVASGAANVVHYLALNMIRADIPPSALGSLQSDPAVVSVTPLSEDAPAVAHAEFSSPPMNTGLGMQPSSGMMAGRLPVPQGQMLPAPPMQLPGAPGAMMAGPAMGMQPPAMPGAGSMLQSVLGLTGQMGMQAGTAMPRAAGMAMIVSGGAQIAQNVLASRKQGCVLTLATAGTQIPEAGGQGVIAVNAPPSCLWQAHSDSEWLQINSEGPMIGAGIVKYSAAAASHGLLRTGVVSISGVANTKVKGTTSITVQQGQ